MGNISNGTGISLERGSDFRIAASGISAGLGGISLARRIYNLDGIDDYWTMPVKQLVSGDTLELKIVAPLSWSSTFNAVIYSGSSGDRIYITTAFAWQLDVPTGSVVSVDGVIVNTGDAAPSTGVMHVIRVVFGAATDIAFIGISHTLTSPSYFPIYDIDIQAASGNCFHPVNDGWLANPRIANTLDPSGLTDGTAFNFNEERWVYV